MARWLKARAAVSCAAGVHRENDAERPPSNPYQLLVFMERIRDTRRHGGREKKKGNNWHQHDDAFRLTRLLGPW